MEQIKLMSPSERPRERMQSHGAKALSDQELIAILLGSGTPQVPLHAICAALLKDHPITEIVQMDMETLCGFKGIGPAKATIILAAAEFCRRAERTMIVLKDDEACYGHLRLLLEPATQLQYILLLISGSRELLAFCEAGSFLPDLTWITRMAMEAGAARLLLGRNGWSAFSNSEGRFVLQLRSACSALGIICEGLMAVGPERFKMI